MREIRKESKPNTEEEVVDVSSRVMISQRKQQHRKEVVLLIESWINISRPSENKRGRNVRI